MMPPTPTTVRVFVPPAEKKEALAKHLGLLAATLMTGYVAGIADTRHLESIPVDRFVDLAARIHAEAQREVAGE
jgi:hypothetical protein